MAPTRALKKTSRARRLNFLLAASCGYRLLHAAMKASFWPLVIQRSADTDVRILSQAKFASVKWI